MKNYKYHTIILYLTMLMIAAALFFYGDVVLFNLTYFAIFLFVSARAIQSTGRKRMRFLFIVIYFMIYVLQIVFYTHIADGYLVWSEHPYRKLFVSAAIFLPLVISRYVTVSKYTELYLPTFHEAAMISFSQLHAFTGNIRQTIDEMGKIRTSLTPGNFKYIIDDLPRHNSFRYVNAKSLTEDYFRTAEKSLDDLFLYIIVCDTGTPASEIISVFTHNYFNHASISFDAALETIVSYNSGDRIYPPGLNLELVEYLNKKADASILVYRLPVTREQKQKALDKVAEINRDGSAYNMLGLVFGKSVKPNIMYCSQFVYGMLKYIDASYFDVENVIKPTDFIEKDYHRKLEFVEKIRLNEKQMS